MDPEPKPDPLRMMLDRIYAYIEAVNHLHLPDGTILYASEVWDVLHQESPIHGPTN
jgi:hypothetical protein